ncbi:MAG: flagellar protein FliT [Sphingobacteriia bacterium]|nr:flagellar protein FliT [Sphingobacteriia bacterium]NCC41435.1 flagellar protein FliT [Gammaproteobacteria bacterium]
MLSVIELDSLVARYEAMAAAARAEDWDRLVALESDVAELRQKMQATATAASAQPIAGTMTESDVLEMTRRIEHVLALDAEIRAQVEPYLESLRRLLASRARDRALRRAYGV